MPLIHGYSRRSISKNIATEMRAGKPRSRSVAIAFNVASRALLQHAAEMRRHAQALLRGVRGDQKKRLREAEDRVREVSARFSTSGIVPNPWTADLHTALAKLAEQIRREHATKYIRA